jgi:hypothetical protein
MRLTIDAAGYYTAHSTSNVRFSRDITETEYATAHVDAMNAGTSIIHELETMMRADVDRIMAAEGYRIGGDAALIDARRTHDMTHDGTNPRCVHCTNAATLDAAAAERVGGCGDPSCGRAHA